MSWLSPPGLLLARRRSGRRVAALLGLRLRRRLRRRPPNVAPPSIERLNDAHRKYVSLGLSVATAMRV